MILITVGLNQIYLFILYSQKAGTGINLLKENFSCLGRQDLFCFFRPFHEAEIAGIKTVFNARQNYFLNIFQPVQVNMINYSGRKFILVNDRKSWTGHITANSDKVAKCMDKRCLPRSYSTVKCEDLISLFNLPNFFYNIVNIVQWKQKLHVAKLTNRAMDPENCNVVEKIVVVLYWHALHFGGNFA